MNYERVVEVVLHEAMKHHNGSSEAKWYRFSIGCCEASTVQPEFECLFVFSYHHGNVLSRRIGWFVS
jgi:hypothetical protein